MIELGRNSIAAHQNVLGKRRAEAPDPMTGPNCSCLCRSRIAVAQPQLSSLPMFSSLLLILNPNEPLESQYPMIPLLLSFRLLVELFFGSAGGRKAFAFSVPCPRFDWRFSASRPSLTEFLPLNGVTWTPARKSTSRCQPTGTRRVHLSNVDLI